MGGRDDELSQLMARLAHRQRVYVRSGRIPSTPGGLDGLRAAVAAEAHVVIRTLWKDWKQWASDRSGPASAQQVEEALEALTAERAVELMAWLAAQCLVWPGASFMERSEADTVARRVGQLLGPDAHWWSTFDPELECCVSCVSACTFDGLVTGTDGRRFVVLIQVGED
ncbi:hypothetical protein [Streptomyces puniciscabiei]|uniref:hypothetical protein n=1 Tax=Streptomyces puniciscabiei TaxID=164348 RepID=UPI00332B04E4